MKKKLNLFGYKITSSPDFMDDQNAMTPELKKQMESLYALAISGKKSAIKTFHKLIEKHPNNPQLKNYLSVLYHSQGNMKKAIDVTQWIVAEHPDYLFGKLNIAFQHYYAKRYDKMLEVLGKELEISALYPKRDSFHISEVTGFLKATTFYFIGKENLEEAEKRLQLLTEIDPDSQDAEETEKEVLIYRMQHVFKREKELDKKRIKVVTKMPQKQKKNTKAPVFTHPEIQALYKKDIKLLIDDLETLLRLPRKTLIEDLELVLRDSMDRFGVYAKSIQEDDTNTDSISFVIHAVYLLGELEATASVALILEVLQESKEYIEFFIGDFITEGFWEPLYKLIPDELERCKSFMCLPAVYTYSKSELSEAVMQIALNQPSKKEEVISWYGAVFDFYIHASTTDNVLDSTLIGLLMANVIELEAVKLLPLIEELYKQHKVDESVCGSYTTVLITLKQKNSQHLKKDVLSIKERYKRIVVTWTSYIENDTQDISLDLEKSGLQPIIKEKKIGRNEPCPCGSGKKYKKCCMNT